MYGHQVGKVVGAGGGGGMNWAIGIDMYTLMCIKWITNKNLLYKKNFFKFKKKWSEKWVSIMIYVAFIIVIIINSLPYIV